MSNDPAGGFGINPYATPSADLTPESVATSPDQERDEQVRRENLGRETNIKSIGSLYILGTIIQGLGLAGNGLQLSQVGVMSAEQVGRLMANISVSGAMFALSLALAIGLHGLRAWARWTALVLNGLGVALILVALALSPFTGLPTPVVVGLAVVVLITGAIVYVLATPPSGLVCTQEYREIIRRTPHVKYRTSRVALFALLAVISLVVLGVIAGILSSR